MLIRGARSQNLLICLFRFLKKVAEGEAAFPDLMTFQHRPHGRGRGGARVGAGAGRRGSFLITPAQVGVGGTEELLASPAARVPQCMGTSGGASALTPIHSPLPSHQRDFLALAPSPPGRHCAV